MEKLLLLSGICLIFLCLIPRSSTQRLPPIACPQYFEYLSYNQQFIGHISIVLDPLIEVNNLVVQFSQYGAYDWSYVGSLTLWDDQTTTTSNIRRSEPVNYRVDFPIPGSPPKLTEIKLNNLVLCGATQYGRPRTAISLMHTLRSTVGPLAFLGGSQRNPLFQIQSNPFENQSIFITQPQEYTTPRVQPVQRVQPTRRVQPTQRVPPAQPILQVQPQQPQWQNQPEPEFNNIEPQISQPVSAICGRERLTTTPLIFRGKPLERGQIPWLVGLFERNAEHALIFFCGGTLISASTVISAAHCFRHPGRDLPASQVVVSLGRNTIDLVSSGELRDVSQLLIHDQYKPAEYTQADLVLIRMATPVTFNNYIVPICLWSDSFPLQLPSGYKAYVAGFGADENGNVNTQTSKITDTDIVTESNCLRELPSRLVQSNTLCAKKSGAGPCASDGGGGLMLRENNVWLLRAVISGGQRKENTCDLSKPAVYTDVAKHIAWVRQNIWE